MEVLMGNYLEMADAQCTKTLLELFEVILSSFQDVSSFYLEWPQ